MSPAHSAPAAKCPHKQLSLGRARGSAAGSQHPSLTRGAHCVQTVPARAASFWGLEFPALLGSGCPCDQPQGKALGTGTAELPWRTALPWEGLLAAHAWSLLDCTPCTSSLCWCRFVCFCWNKSEPQVRSHAESCESSKQSPELGWPCGDPTQAPQNPRQTVSVRGSQRLSIWLSERPRRVKPHTLPSLAHPQLGHRSSAG